MLYYIYEEEIQMKLSKAEIDSKISQCEKIIRMVGEESPIAIAAKAEIKKLKTIWSEMPIITLEKQMVFNVSFKVRVKGSDNPEDYSFMKEDFSDRFHDLLVDAIFDSVSDVNDYEEPYSLDVEVSERKPND